MKRALIYLMIILVILVSLSCKLDPKLKEADIVEDSLLGKVYKQAPHDVAVVEIPYGVNRIADGAFGNAVWLKEVTIPDTVTEIGKEAFFGCTGLTSITIPNSVTNIGSDAFTGCTCSVVFASGMTTIPSNALSWADGISSITIPNTVTSIGSKAFMGCTKLANLRFEGTVAQWGDVSKGLDWRAGVPTSVIHCSDGDVNK